VYVVGLFVLQGLKQTVPSIFLLDVHGILYPSVYTDGYFGTPLSGKSSQSLALYFHIVTGYSQFFSLLTMINVSDPWQSYYNFNEKCEE
jgi:hypothetical protein